MRNLCTLVLFLFSGILIAQNRDLIRAQNYFRNGEFEIALQLYEKLARKSPYNSTYLKRLVTCYQETNQYNKAEKVLNQKLDFNPRFIHINVLLGENYERQKDTINAKLYYEKAINGIDKYHGYGTMVASIFKDKNKLNYAIKAYQKSEANTKGANYGFQIAQLYGEKGNFKQMFESYMNYLDGNENYLNTIKRYTAGYVTDDPENKNNITFKKTLLRRSASNPKNVWNNLLAWLFTKQKNYGKAFIQYKALYARTEENLNNFKQLGKISLENKNYEVAKQCFDFIIEKADYPEEKFEAISNKLNIAVLTKKPNVNNLFEEVFNEFGVNQNTFPVQLTYANYLTFTKNNPQKAKEVLEKALKNAKTNSLKAKIKLKLGEVLVYQNKFNKALIYFSQVQSQFKNHQLGQEARFKVAQTSYFKSDFKWAKAQLKILKGSATQLIANDAASLFLIISDNQPKDSAATGLSKYAKANLLAYQNKNKEAIELLNDVVVKFKGQPIEDEALFKQSELYRKIGDTKKALWNLEKIILLNKKNENKEGILVDDSLFILAKIYQEKNDIEKAKLYYQKIIFEHPSSIYLVDARKEFRKLRGDHIN